MMLLAERNAPRQARLALEVANEPPLAVTPFRIGPVPTPLELLPLAEQKVRAIDAKRRRELLESIGRELLAHSVYPQSAGGFVLRVPWGRSINPMSEYPGTRGIRAPSRDPAMYLHRFEADTVRRCCVRTRWRPSPLRRTPTGAETEQSRAASSAQRG
jgi:hypothetical protein